MKNGQGPGAQSLRIISGYWNREYFKRSILSEINRSALPSLFQRFNIVIPADEQPDPDAFAEAITEQFQALLFNNGEADAIISEVYSKYSNTFSITYYLQNAKEKYSMVKNLLYPSEPKPFYDSFVCNHIEGIHNDPVTLDDVFGLSSYVILAGTGGIGKSMLMQHLLLDGIDHFNNSGYVPVLITLRRFEGENANLFSMIHESVFRFDERFTEEKLKDRKLRILLDGVDEIKGEFIKGFQEQLDLLIDHYPGNQIVISSRPYSSFVEFVRFKVCNILPFTQEQSLTLIDKLDYCPEDPDVKARFREQLKEKYCKTHSDFAENPLLLTLMLMCYHRFGEISNKKHAFYEQAYQTLLHRHDSTKTAYSRVFRSVDNSYDFTMVFREFCAKSYRKGDIKISGKTAEEYFAKLNSVKQLYSSKMTLDNFLYDACNTVCLMYESGDAYYFRHRSFQEYFFADYYSREEDSILLKLGKYFSSISYNPCVHDGLRLLNNLAPEKTEHLVLLPFLESVFSYENEREQFWHFLSHGYHHFEYTVIYRDIYHKYSGEYKPCDWCDMAHKDGQVLCHNTLLTYISRQHSFQHVFTIKRNMLTMNDLTNLIDACRPIHGMIDEENATILTFPVNNPETSLEKEKFIKDNNGEFVIFGYLCRIIFEAIFENSENDSAICSLFENKNDEIWKHFQQVKSLYESWKAKYENADDPEDDDF